MPVKLTQEEFIKRANQVHNFKYDYSKSIYVNSYTKVCIICSIHGEFWQKPDNHLRGKGCFYCFNQNKQLTQSEFIERSSKKHQNFYDYSLVRYKDSRLKVCIICPIHGKFWQIAQNHFNGCKCPKCTHEKLFSNTLDFIQKAKQIHGDKYNYSKVNYNKAIIKVCIICSKHGEFWQTPANHLRGQGCPSCKKSKGEILIEKWLNEQDIDFIDQYKFDGCVGYRRRLPFDFYLPKYNTCIEYDGKQHFIAMGYSKGNQRLETSKRNDSIKNKFCKDHGINLYRISYKENIEEKLKELYLSGLLLQNSLVA